MYFLIIKKFSYFLDRSIYLIATSNFSDQNSNLFAILRYLLYHISTVFTIYNAHKTKLLFFYSILKSKKPLCRRTCFLNLLFRNLKFLLLFNFTDANSKIDYIASFVLNLKKFNDFLSKFCTLHTLSIKYRILTLRI